METLRDRGDTECPVSLWSFGRGAAGVALDASAAEVGCEGLMTAGADTRGVLMAEAMGSALAEANDRAKVAAETSTGVLILILTLIFFIGNLQNHTVIVEKYTNMPGPMRHCSCKDITKTFGFYKRAK